MPHQSEQCQQGRRAAERAAAPLTAAEQCQQMMGLGAPVLTAYAEPVQLPPASDARGRASGESRSPARTALFTAYADPQPSAPFLSEDNARWLQRQLEAALTKSTGRTVRVPLDGRFIQEMQAIATHSLRPAPDGVGVAAMNRTFLERYFELQVASISHGALFHKYFIAQDRPWTFPYGEYTHDNSVLVSPSGYQTSHPWRLRQPSLLRATTGLQAEGLRTAALSTRDMQGLFVPGPTAYCRI